MCIPLRMSQIFLRQMYVSEVKRELCWASAAQFKASSCPQEVLQIISPSQRVYPAWTTEQGYTVKDSAKGPPIGSLNYPRAPCFCLSGGKSQFL